MAQSAKTVASLRGISVVDARVAWASGSGGTFLRTIDGGERWQAAIVPGAEALDFRGIVARSAQVAWMVSSGEGDKSRIYRTGDGGKTWQLLLANPDPKGFFDGIAFWDARHGIVFGDPVDGAFVILTTEDAGGTWKRQSGPAAVQGEGAFAASNSSLVVRRSGSGAGEVWFATGGIGAARVFHSTDGGQNWTAAVTPVRNDSAGAGIFSLAVLRVQLVAVGGDYAKPGDKARNIAISNDAGATWQPAGAGPRGYRSAVAYLPRTNMLLAAGPSGSEWSRDNGQTWTAFDDGAFNAIGVGKGDACWAVGPQGRIARFLPNREKR